MRKNKNVTEKFKRCAGSLVMMMNDDHDDSDDYSFFLGFIVGCKSLLWLLILLERTASEIILSSRFLPSLL